MKCKEIKKILINYIDGNIDNALKLILEEHLKHCETCSDQVKLLDKVVEIYRKDSPFSLPDEMRKELFKTVKKYCKK